MLKLQKTCRNSITLTLPIPSKSEVETDSHRHKGRLSLNCVSCLYDLSLRGYLSDCFSGSFLSHWLIAAENNMFFHTSAEFIDDHSKAAYIAFVFQVLLGFRRSFFLRCGFYCFFHSFRLCRFLCRCYFLGRSFYWFLCRYFLCGFCRGFFRWHL